MAAAAIVASGMRHAWMRFIIDHNPCYLLSAACMLVGCYLLNVALYTPAGDVGKLLVVLGVVNLYELLILLLARVLIRYAVLGRDARILLFVEALFLVDVTFVSGVIATVDAWSGGLVNVAVLLLAGLKAWAALLILGAGDRGRVWTFVMLQVLVLLALPVAFKAVSVPGRGWISPVAVYLAWCVAGLVPVAGTVIYLSRPRGATPASRSGPLLVGLYLALPFASLLVHLYSAAWVYSVDFVAPFAAPVFVGFAVAMRCADRWAVPAHVIARAQAVLLGGALWLSATFPSELMFRWPAATGIVLSPLRVVLIAVAAVCVLALWRQYRAGFVVAAVGCAVVALLGPSVSSIQQSLYQLGQTAVAMGRRGVPRSALDWGVTAVVGAFALLACGAVFSLKRARMERDTEVSEAG